MGYWYRRGTDGSFARRRDAPSLWAMLNIRYGNGKVLQGILLAIGDQKIRVAVKDSDDVAEYRLISSRWVSEDCEVVTISIEEESVLLAGDELPESLLAGRLEQPVISRIM
jgi:hypothetical protein